MRQSILKKRSKTFHECDDPSNAEWPKLEGVVEGGCAFSTNFRMCVFSANFFGESTKIFFFLLLDEFINWEKVPKQIRSRPGGAAPTRTNKWQATKNDEGKRNFLNWHHAQLESSWKFFVGEERWKFFESKKLKTLILKIMKLTQFFVYKNCPYFLYIEIYKIGPYFLLRIKIFQGQL